MLRCGVALDLCNSIQLNCTNLLLFTQTFVPDPNLDVTECENAFANYFNGVFNTSYVFGEIIDLFKTMCDIDVKICDPQPPNSCVEVKYVQDIFDIFYPDPQTQIPQGRCRDVFTALFNITYGTSYTYEEVNTYFYNLCGEYLAICGYDCDVYIDFVEDFEAQYGHLQIPLSAKEILFTYLYNQQFIWGNSQNPHSATGIINNGGVIGIVPPVGWNSTMVVSYEQIKSALSDCISGEIVSGEETVAFDDCTTLEDMKQLFMLMYPYGFPEDCSLIFTSWFNFTMQTQFSSEELQVHYNDYCGNGSGEICPSLDIPETY